MRRNRRLAVLLATSVLAFSSCSTNGDRDPTTSTPPPTTLAPETSQASLAPTTAMTSPVTTASVSRVDCGTVATAEPNQRLVVLRGVTCDAARQVLAQYDAFQAGGPAPSDGWQCALGRQGDEHTLRCGSGSNGALQDSPLLFILVTG